MYPYVFQDICINVYVHKIIFKNNHNHKTIIIYEPNWRGLFFDGIVAVVNCYFNQYELIKN